MNEKLTNTAIDPQHYHTKIQPIDYITANNLGFCEGNIIKYITRHKAKNGAEDIKKAIRYCEFILEQQYGEPKKEPTRERDNPFDVKCCYEYIGDPSEEFTPGEEYLCKNTTVSSCLFSGNTSAFYLPLEYCEHNFKLLNK